MNDIPDNCINGHKIVSVVCRGCYEMMVEKVKEADRWGQENVCREVNLREYLEQKLRQVEESRDHWKEAHQAAIRVGEKFANERDAEERRRLTWMSDCQKMETRYDEAMARVRELEERLPRYTPVERLDRAMAVIEGTEKALRPFADNAFRALGYRVVCGVGCDMGEAGPGMPGMHDEGCPMIAAQIAFSAIRGFKGENK